MCSIPISGTLPGTVSGKLFSVFVRKFVRTQFSPRTAGRNHNKNNMATLLASFQSPPPPLPLDLLLPGRPAITRPSSLLESIQATVQKIPDLQLCPIAARSSGPAFQSKVLLAVLTYCYVTEVWAASELGKRLLANPGCRAALGGEFPTPCEVRAFRQLNRQMLERSVIAALRFSEAQKAQQDGALPPHDRWLEDEARRRILMAACLDSMELDDTSFSC